MRYKMFISFMVINFKVLKKKCQYSIIIHHVIELYILHVLIIDNFIKKNAAGNRAILASGKNKKVIHICKDFLEVSSQKFQLFIIQSINLLRVYMAKLRT